MLLLAVHSTCRIHSGVPYLSVLQSYENNVSRACSSFFVAGVTGNSTQRVGDVLYGSHIKVRPLPALTSPDGMYFIIMA